MARLSRISGLPAVALAKARTSRGRRLAWGAAVLLLLSCAYGFVHLGTFLVYEEPLEKADAIFVYAGSQAERPLEAVDLYKAGYAPIVVLTRPKEEPAVDLLASRGIMLPTRYSLMREVLDKLGVPDAAIVVPDRIHDSTAAEAETLRELVASRGWRRVIVVSSKYHLRRVKLSSERALRGTDVDVIVRGTKYDSVQPSRWWLERADIRTLLWEYPKLVSYMLGLGA
jgi:uncharacterized SAM-binding protein YcdF (DUF218 family)